MMKKYKETYMMFDVIFQKVWLVTFYKKKSMVGHYNFVVDVLVLVAVNRN